MHTPSEIIWEHQVSDFIDGLVEHDIDYLDIEMAIERIVHSGLHDMVATQFEFEGQTLYAHLVPSLKPHLKPVWVFSRIEQTGAILILFACFN